MQNKVKTLFAYILTRVNKRNDIQGTNIPYIIVNITRAGVKFSEYLFSQITCNIRWNDSKDDIIDVVHSKWETHLSHNIYFLSHNTDTAGPAILGGPGGHAPPTFFLRFLFFFGSKRSLLWFFVRRKLLTKFYIQCDLLWAYLCIFKFWQLKRDIQN